MTLDTSALADATTGSGSRRTHGGHVSFRMRRLEPYIALALAGATAWTTILQFPESFNAWACALAALAIYGWSRSYPATMAWLMVARAALLLLLALVLRTEAPELRPETDLYAFWPVSIAVGYALLLRTRMGLLVVALACGEFMLSEAMGRQHHALRNALSDFGLLLASSLAALAFGRSIMRSELQTEAAFTDAQTGMYNKAGLFAYGNELAADCLANNRALCMALLNCRDLGDVRELMGRKTASRMFSEAVERVARSAPRAGLVARTERLEFVVVLPGLDSKRTKSLMQDSLGSPPSLRLKVDGTMLEVFMDVTVASLGDRVQDVEALYELAQAKLQNRHRPPEPEDEPESILAESGGPLSRFEPSPTLPLPLQ